MKRGKIVLNAMTGQVSRKLRIPHWIWQHEGPGYPTEELHWCSEIEETKTAHIEIIREEICCKGKWRNGEVSRRVTGELKAGFYLLMYLK